MIKVAVLDDYQDVFQQIVESEKYKNKFEFQVFKDPFLNENETIVALEEFEALFIMRERTPITKKEFDMMKRSSFLINTSRGSIINENDLIKALKDERIAGAGLDVYDKEPLPQDHKLRFLPNAFLLPHIGYVTAENYNMFYTQMIENLEACLKGEPLRIIS
jgi:phosphoglycerate dehydrogenase-like enzyme